MDKLDRLIEEALEEEERALLAETRELGFFTQLGLQMRGRNAWVNWITSFALFVYAGLLLWVGWQFFTATDPLTALKWGLGGGIIVVVIGMLKLYLLGQMQTERIIRELKRVELMLAARDRP